MSKSSFARGRISQVIASARSEQHPTLNEPTRPVTPASLDMRTSLHGISLDAIQRPTVIKKKKATSSRSRKASSSDSIPIDDPKITNKSKENNIYISSDEKEEILDFFGEEAVDVSEENITGDLEIMTNLYRDLQSFCDEIKKATSGMPLLSLSEVVSAGLGNALKRLKIDSSVYQDYKLQNLSQPLAEVISGINLFCSEADWLNLLNATILRLCSQLAAVEDFSLYEKSRTLKNMEVLLEFIHNGRTNGNGAGGIDESVDLSLNLSSDNDEIAVIIVPAVLECIQFTITRLQLVFRVHEESFEGQRQQLKLTPDHYTASLLNITAYCTAILRLLSQTEIDRRRLVRVQGLQTIMTVIDFFQQHSNLLRKITILNEDGSSPVQNAAVAPLVQIVGIIRNLSLDKTCRQALSNSPSISTTMCSFLRTYIEYPEVILNITRVLAKLSLYEWFRSQVSDNLDALVYVLRQEGQRCQQVMNGKQSGDGKDNNGDNNKAWPEWYTWPLISRMAFALGNFTTTNENNRRLIGITHGGANSVVTLFQVSVSAMMRIHEIKMEQRKAEQETGVFMFAKAKAATAAANPYVSLDEEDDGKVSGTEEVDQAVEQELRDAIIKLVRLMANLSIDSEVGLDMGSDRENLHSLHDLLTFCGSSNEQPQQQSSEQEEMQLNVIAALTNLTFYSCQHLDTLTSPSSLSATDLAQNKKVAVKLEKLLATIAVSVSDGLFHKNTEIVLETGRVLGNLTRRPLVITTLVQRRIDEALLMLLTHINTEVIAAIAGVFVNFSACQEGRLALLQRTQPVIIVPHLSSMLRRLQLKDVQIAMLFTQILYNLITAAEYLTLNAELSTAWQPQSLLDTLEEWLDLVSEEDDRDRQRDVNHMQQMFIQVAQALQQHLLSKQREGLVEKK